MKSLNTTAVPIQMPGEKIKMCIIAIRIVKPDDSFFSSSSDIFESKLRNQWYVYPLVESPKRSNGLDLFPNLVDLSRVSIDAI